jgi:hypothetical protein
LAVEQKERNLVMADNFCFNHSDAPAVARCSVCGKAVCSQCVVSRNGGNYCSEACASRAESSAGRVDTALGDKKKIDAKLRLRGIIIVVVLIAAVAAGIFYYRNNKDDVDRAVRKAGKQVSSKAEGAKKSIQKGIPTSSSYKREKEGLVK